MCAGIHTGHVIIHRFVGDGNHKATRCYWAVQVEASAGTAECRDYKILIYFDVLATGNICIVTVAINGS